MRLAAAAPAPAMRAPPVASGNRAVLPVPAAGPPLPCPPLPAVPGLAQAVSRPRGVSSPRPSEAHLRVFLLFFFLGTRGVRGNLALESVASDGAGGTRSGPRELTRPGAELSPGPRGQGAGLERSWTAPAAGNLVQQKGWSSSCLPPLGDDAALLHRDTRRRKS